MVAAPIHLYNSPVLDGFFHYAFLDRRLMGSEHPGARGNAQQRVSEMVGDGEITAILTLAGNFREYRLANIVQLHRPMPEVPSRDQVAEAIGIVGAHLASGHRVWVHCQRGLDRTGAVIGGYLCQTGLAPDQVIAMLLERFPPARRQPAMRKLWQPFERLIRSFSKSDECEIRPRSSPLAFRPDPHV